MRFSATAGGSWNATSATPWLRVLTPSGVQGEDIRVEVDEAQMLAESGLPIISADTMAEAATKIVAAVK